MEVRRQAEGLVRQQLQGLSALHEFTTHCGAAIDFMGLICTASAWGMLAPKCFSAVEVSPKCHVKLLPNANNLSRRRQARHNSTAMYPTAAQCRSGQECPPARGPCCSSSRAAPAATASCRFQLPLPLRGTCLALPASRVSRRAAMPLGWQTWLLSAMSSIRRCARGSGYSCVMQTWATT